MTGNPFVAGKDGLDRRYLTKEVAAATYQVIDANIAKKVYLNGVQVANPIVSSGSSVIVSTGSSGGYAVPFGVTYAANPNVVAWAGIESGGNFVLANWTSVSTTGFQVYLIIPTGAGSAVPSGHTTTVYWQAIGA